MIRKGRQRRKQVTGFKEGNRVGGVIKFAASLPSVVFYAIDKRCSHEGLTRSAALNEAAQMWLRQKEEWELEARYVQGYQKKPEKPADRDAFYQAGLASFSPDEW